MVSKQFAEDYVAGMVGLGIPDAIGLAVAIAEGDEEDALHYAKVIGATHATWLAAWKLVKQYDMLRHGAKNLSGLNFHKIMSGVRFLSTRALGGPVMIAAAGSMFAQRELYQMVDAEMEGAITYSRAGQMSGNRGPIIPRLITLDDFKRGLDEIAKDLGF